MFLQKDVLTFIVDNIRCLNLGEFSHGKMQQTMPPSLEKDETDLSNFFDSCRDLCNRLLELFAIALQVCIIYILPKFVINTNTFNIFRYRRKMAGKNGLHQDMIPAKDHLEVF